MFPRIQRGITALLLVLAVSLAACPKARTEAGRQTLDALAERVWPLPGVRITDPRLVELVAAAEHDAHEACMLKAWNDDVRAVIESGLTLVGTVSNPDGPEMVELKTRDGTEVWLQPAIVDGELVLERVSLQRPLGDMTPSRCD